eukprot:3768206-Pleurochrysis_carterae.AAC.1
MQRDIGAWARLCVRWYVCAARDTSRRACTHASRPSRLRSGMHACPAWPMSWSTYGLWSMAISRGAQERLRIACVRE